jgi:hypothetical protein
MNLGDLVTPTNNSGCNLCSDEGFVEVFHENVMRSGEIGTILEIKRLNTNIKSDVLLKILCSGGSVGWVYTHWVKVVNEPR